MSKDQLIEKIIAAVKPGIDRYMSPKEKERIYNYIVWEVEVYLAEERNKKEAEEKFDAFFDVPKVL